MPLSFLIRHFPIFLLNVLVVALTALIALALAPEGAAGQPLAQSLPLQSIAPFAGILLSIALIPLLKPHFWNRHYGKVVATWALMTAIPFLLIYRGEGFYAILHIYLIDYVPFIILLWGLYTASGGILLRGRLAGTPLVNTGILAVGTLLASWMGTTGASMLLIRPLLRANSARDDKVHLVVFFIILVSNVGGALTPLGDPPLFLGFLHGVPFFWTTRNLLPHMVLMSLSLLALFYLVDSWYYRHEGRPVSPLDDDHQGPLRLEGLVNFVFLASIMGAVLASGLWQSGTEFHLGDVHIKLENIARDLTIVLCGLLSLHFTPQVLRQANGFTWEPIKEVAYLFAGIFMTIVPALTILQAGDQGALAAITRFTQSEATYFWVTGSLSSYLDNAPTYLTFFSSALGNLNLDEITIRRALPLPPNQWAALGIDPALIGRFSDYLKGISLGAVFMGANTYIGNAPNFIVKSMAEETGVAMPSFFGYILYTCVLLLPLYFAMTLLFF